MLCIWDKAYERPFRVPNIINKQQQKKSVIDISSSIYVYIFFFSFLSFGLWWYFSFSCSFCLFCLHWMCFGSISFCIVCFKRKTNNSNSDTSFMIVATTMLFVQLLFAMGWVNSKQIICCCCTLAPHFMPFHFPNCVLGQPMINR